MYAFNRLLIHSTDPSEPSFQGIKQLIRYLSGHPNHPIRYTTGIDGTTTHDLHQEFTQANSTPKIYPMASLIFLTVEKDVPSMTNSP